MNKSAGIGIDLVELDRFQGALEHEGFRKKVFTPAEIEECESKPNPLQSYAARFAIKEAFYKALADPRLKSVPWKQIATTIRDEGPVLKLSGALEEKLADRTPYISLTHTERTAAAVVLLLPASVTLTSDDIIRDNSS